MALYSLPDKNPASSIRPPKVFRLIASFFFLSFLTACAAIPLPETPLDPNMELHSLSSTIRVTVETAGKRVSADGYLLYRRPDRFRLTILNPFGLTAAEVFLSGENLLYLQGGSGYSGLVSEVPDARGIRSWRMIGWVMETVAPQEEGPLVRRRDGTTETVYFDDRGLVTRKTTGRGDEITYSDYISEGGVPIAGKVVMKDREGDSVVIRLEEPEANAPLEDSAFSPSLEGVTVLPLSSFRVPR